MAKKNPHAVALGRLGGLKRNASLSDERKEAIARAAGQKGGAARAAKLTDNRMSEIAKHALHARWARWRKANGKPPKPGDEAFLDAAKDDKQARLAEISRNMKARSPKPF